MAADVAAPCRLENDPFGTATTIKIAGWSLAAVLLSLAVGPTLLRGLWPPAQQGNDFFLGWASARSFLDGGPLQISVEDAARLYLGADAQADIAHTSHPPPAVLLTLPLAGLSYPAANFVWNIFSLACLAASIAVVIRELQIRFPLWALLPTWTVLLLWNPLHQQILQGQLNLVLLFCITMAWRADRHGRLGRAGAWLATAAAIKLFPAYVFLYFLMRRQWRAIVIGGITFFFLAGAATSLFGVEAYRQHLEEGLPYLHRYRAEWMNASVPGWWYRLFDAGPGFPQRQVAMLWHSPLSARIGILLCTAGVLIWNAIFLLRAATRPSLDRAYAFTVTATLVVSLFTWDHYFTLLLLPLVLLWLQWERMGPWRMLFLSCVLILAVHPFVLWSTCRLTATSQPQTAAPWQCVTGLSLQVYALLGLLVLQWRQGPADQEPSP